MSRPQAGARDPPRRPREAPRQPQDRGERDVGDHRVGRGQRVARLRRVADQERRRQLVHGGVAGGRVDGDRVDVDAPHRREPESQRRERDDPRAAAEVEQARRAGCPGSPRGTGACSRARRCRRRGRPRRRCRADRRAPGTTGAARRGARSTCGLWKRRQASSQPGRSRVDLEPAERSPSRAQRRDGRRGARRAPSSSQKRSVRRRVRPPASPPAAASSMSADRLGVDVVEASGIGAGGRRPRRRTSRRGAGSARDVPSATPAARRLDLSGRESRSV